MRRIPLAIRRAIVADENDDLGTGQEARDGQDGQEGQEAQEGRDGLDGLEGQEQQDRREAFEAIPEGERLAKRAAAEVKAILEALIFASPDPLTPKAMYKLLDTEPKEEVSAALA